MMNATLGKGDDDADGYMIAETMVFFCERTLYTIYFIEFLTPSKNWTGFAYSVFFGISYFMYKWLESIHLGPYHELGPKVCPSPT